MPPKGKVLADLSTLALENSQPALSAIFWSAFQNEIGNLRTALAGTEVAMAVLNAQEIVRSMLESKPMPEPAELRKRLEAVDGFLRAALNKCQVLTPKDRSEESEEQRRERDGL